MITNKEYCDEFGFELDDEELQILNDIEDGKYTSLSETNPEEFKKEMEIAQIAAKNTIERLTKKKTYTMKLIENDIERIKGMALEKGLPYQTFIASILHQVATKQIKV
jgi:predicted DNA binding CopG/RHH family protein